MRKKDEAKDAIYRHNLVATALRIAISVGYNNLTRTMIAKEFGLSKTIINHRVGSIETVVNEVKELAIETECLPVILQMIAMGDDSIKGKLTEPLKIKIFDYIVSKSSQK